MSVQKGVCFVCHGPAPSRCPCGTPLCGDCAEDPHTEVHERMVNGLAAIKARIQEESPEVHLEGTPDGDMQLSGRFQEGDTLPLIRAVASMRGRVAVATPWSGANPDAMLFLASRVSMDPATRARVYEFAGDEERAAVCISVLTVGYDFDGVVSLFLPLAFCNHELALGVPGHQCGARLMFTTPCTHLSAGKGLGLQVVSLGFTRAVEGFITLDYPQGNSKRFGVLPEHDIPLCPVTQRARALYARMEEAYPKGYAYLRPVLEAIEAAFPDPWSANSGFAHRLLSLRAERNDLQDPSIHITHHLDSVLRWWTRADNDLAMYRSLRLRNTRAAILGGDLPEALKASATALVEGSESRLSFAAFTKKPSTRALFAPCAPEFEEIRAAVRAAGIRLGGLYTVQWTTHAREKAVYAAYERVEIQAWQILLDEGPGTRRFHIKKVKAYLNPTPTPRVGETWRLSRLQTAGLNGKLVRVLGASGDRLKVQTSTRAGNKKYRVKPKNLLHMDQGFWVEAPLQIGRHGTFAYQ